MSDWRPQDLGETPTLEVRVYREGVLVHREMCESEGDAAAVVEAWEEQVGVECEVDDLSARRHGVESLEVEQTDIEDYPSQPDRWS